MQVIENLKLKEKLYIEKLENGLTVMIIPKPNTKKKEVKNNKYAMDAIDFIENRSKRGIGTSKNAE